MEAEITKPLYGIGESVVIKYQVPEAAKPMYRMCEIKGAYWAINHWDYELYAVREMVREKDIISRFKPLLVMAISTGGGSGSNGGARCI
jgi:hypothetical protein